MNYYEDQKAQMPTIIGKRESTENRLERRKKQLEEELEAVNNAIKLFQDHPEISSALDLLGRISI